MANCVKYVALELELIKSNLPVINKTSKLGWPLGKQSAHFGNKSLIIFCKVKYQTCSFLFSYGSRPFKCYTTDIKRHHIKCLLHPHYWLALTFTIKIPFWKSCFITIVYSKNILYKIIYKYKTFKKTVIKDLERDKGLV